MPIKSVKDLLSKASFFRQNLRKTTTITVDKQYADTLNKISAELKEQRASFMSKSEVVQNESPEESKSVNEKYLNYILMNRNFRHLHRL